MDIGKFVSYKKNKSRFLNWRDFTVMSRNFWVYILVGVVIVLGIIFIIYYFYFPRKEENNNFNQNRNKNVNSGVTVEEKQVIGGWNKKEITTKTVVEKPKGEFEEGQTLEFQATITPERDYSDVTIKVFGIKSEYNGYIINETRKAALKKNEVFKQRFSFVLPECSSCSGVEEGTHTIYINVISDNTLIGEDQFNILLRKK